MPRTRRRPAARSPRDLVLAGRDLAVVQTVARFKQLTSTQVHELVFTTSSRTPCDRALKRLVTGRFLARVERRMIGGNNGGASQYVYALGRRGHFMYYSGNYSVPRTVYPHTLAIADAHLVAQRLQRAGLLTIVGYSTEPECWVTIAGTELRPDLRLDITQASGRMLRLWLEIDMGSEGQRQIRGKLEAYWRAYRDADAADWPIFPAVLFVAVDAERAKELAWLISQGPAEAQALFSVTTFALLSQALQG